MLSLPLSRATAHRTGTKLCRSGRPGDSPGIVGLLQASEVIKLILEKGEPLIGRLLTFDALSAEFQELKLYRDPHCPACGEGAHPEDLPTYEEVCAMPA